MRIFSDQSRHGDRRCEFTDISSHVGGSARVIRLPDDFHDRDRRLRRNPGHAAPDEFVKHEVADNQNALARKLAKKFFNSRRFHCSKSGSRKLSLLKEKIAFRMGALLSLKINRYCRILRSSLKLRRTPLDWSFFRMNRNWFRTALIAANCLVS